MQARYQATLQPEIFRNDKKAPPLRSMQALSGDISAEAAFPLWNLNH